MRTTGRFIYLYCSPIIIPKGLSKKGISRSILTTRKFELSTLSHEKNEQEHEFDVLFVGFLHCVNSLRNSLLKHANTIAITSPHSSIGKEERYVS